MCVILTPEIITEEQLDALLDWHGRDGTKCGELTTNALKELRDFRHALSDTATTVTALREALEPFAKVEPMNVYEDEDEDARGSYVLTQSDFRRARKALSTVEKAP